MGTGAGRDETDATADLSLDWPQVTRAHRPTISGEDAMIGWAVADGGMRPAVVPEPAGERSRGGGGTSADAGTAEADGLRSLVADLQAQNADLQAENADLQAENADLRAANAALRHRLGQRPLVAARAGGARKGSVSRRD